MTALIALFAKLAPLFQGALDFLTRWQEQRKLNQSRQDGKNEASLDEIARAEKSNLKAKEAENVINEVESASHIDVRDKLRNEQF